MNVMMLLGHAQRPPIVRPPRVRRDTCRRIVETGQVLRCVTLAPGLTRLQIAELLDMDPRTVAARLTDLRRTRRVTIDCDARDCYWFPLNEDEE